MIFNLNLILLWIWAVCGVEKKDVVLFILDDLRPTLGCYGDANAVTPNIDELARNGTLFERAYAQQSLCAPSRNSLLTSRRPDTIRLYDFYSYWRSTVGNFTTLPQYFKENGYHTKSIGKVFHPGVSSNFTDDDPYSWSEPPFHPITEIFKNAKVCGTRPDLEADLVCPVKVKDQPGGTLPDIESAHEAVKFLKTGKKPFFLAIGFHKPHIPLKYPQKFLRFHPLHKVKLPKVRTKPDDIPTATWNPWTDIRERHDVHLLNISFPYGKVPDWKAKTIIQSYYAAVTYVDSLIGLVMGQVKRTSPNAVVALIGDHGWSLGEHGEWSKYSNYDVATRVPFIISGRPERRQEPVELLDLFPTVVDLSGLPPLRKCSSKSETTCTEGMSRVLKESKEKCTLSQYPRPSTIPQMDSDKPKLKNIHIMGYSCVTRRFRFTKWIRFDQFQLNWTESYGSELYDHLWDRDETINLTECPEYRSTRRELEKLLRRQIIS